LIWTGMGIICCCCCICCCICCCGALRNRSLLFAAKKLLAAASAYIGLSMAAMRDARSIRGERNEDSLATKRKAKTLEALR
jgi:hypothetical protein